MCPIRISAVLAAFGGVTLPAAPAQDIPANSNTVTSEMDVSGGGDGGHLIYVINRSSRMIVVTSVRLLECENVQGSCSTRRMQRRVPPGGRIMVHRVRPRFPDQGFGFRYGFTWEEPPPEGPTAKEVAADRTALEVDTVVVTPKLIDVKVGETVDLGQVLAIEAMNAAGTVFPRVYFATRLLLGAEFLSLEGSKITGKAVGTAALSIAASTVAGPNPSTRGASRILVNVIP